MILAYKKVGQTPLELIKELREEGRVGEKEKATYAGRLDPMAEGLMLILTDKEAKDKERYLKLDKVYETTILFGLSTDTYDALGLVTENNLSPMPKIEKVKEVIKKYILNLKEIDYPPFSSKTVEGRPLWSWYKMGKINEINIPKRDIEIKNIKVIEFKKENLEKIILSAIDNINKVKGKFRQSEIINCWKKALKHNGKEEVLLVTLRIHCSSGTYIRSLANILGEEIGTGALALNIKRISIGDKFKISAALPSN